MRTILIFAALLWLTILPCHAQKTNHHGVFWGRLVLADTINSKLRWDLYLQKRTQNAGTNNLFEAPHFFSIWPWLSYGVSKSTRVSLSPIGYFDSHLFYNSPEDVKDEGVKEYRVSLRVENEQNCNF